MTVTPTVAGVDDVKAKATQELAAADSQEALERWRVAYLGRRGLLTQILRGLGSLAPEERRKVGAASNEAKSALQDSLARKEDALREVEVSDLLERDAIDVTLPGRPVSTGGVHPTTQTIREICDVFATMGFQAVEGPEVEWDRYNFEKLNIPKDHPARGYVEHPVGRLHRRERGPAHAPAHPHLADAGADYGEPEAAGARRRAGQVLPL